jgi:hypothetical protein
MDSDAKALNTTRFIVALLVLFCRRRVQGANFTLAQSAEPPHHRTARLEAGSTDYGSTLSRAAKLLPLMCKLRALIHRTTKSLVKLGLWLQKSSTKQSKVFRTGDIRLP